MKRIINKRYFSLITGLALILIALLSENLFAPWLNSLYLRQRVQSAREHLAHKEEVAEEFLLAAKKENPLKNRQAFVSKSNNEGVYFYIYSSNNLHLLFWTSNSIFPKVAPFQDTTILEHLSNGYYLQKNTFYKDNILITLIPIQYNYAFQNTYLQNTFALLQTGGDDFHISQKREHKGEAFFSRGGQFLFDLQINNYQPDYYWIGWLFLAGIFIYGLFMHKWLSFLLSKTNFIPGILVYIVCIALPIAVWKLFRYPRALFDWQVFSPKLYASSLILSSLGYVLILSILLCWTAWIFCRVRLKSFPPYFRRVLVILQLTAVFMFGHAISRLIHSLVFDSSISFDLGNISGISIYTILAFLAVAGFMLGYFILLKVAVINAFRIFIDRGKVLIAIAAVCISLVIISLFLFHISLAAFTFSLACLVFYSYQYKKVRPLVLLAWVTVVSALFITIVLIANNIAKERENQKVLASRLFSERDVISEYLYGDIYSSIKDDNYIQAYFTSPFISQPILRQRIEQIYLSDYFSNYDVDLYSYTAQGLPYKGNSEFPLSYFEHYIYKAIPAREDSSLFFLSFYNGLPNTYLSRIPIEKDGQFLGTVVLLFSQKPFYEESVYPELILSENLQPLNRFQDYSYAVYLNRYLTTQKGNYSYSDILKGDFLPAGSYKIINADGYTHFVYRITQDQTIVVSDRDKELLYYTASFSFILFFFFILVVLITFGRFIIPGIIAQYKRGAGSIKEKLRDVWRNLSFRSKVLLTIISTMTGALIMIGFATVYYISHHYNQDELEKLRNKSRSVKERIEAQLKSELLLAPVQSEELTGLIKNLSKLYQADINVYDIEGRLLASSQPIIYEKGIIQPRIDPSAYYNFVSESKTQFVREENIGKLKYIASYLPLRNFNGQTSAFVSLPFFARERELDSAISSFLVALINLYLGIFLLLMGLSIGIANALTSPLNIIRKHLRTASLTAKNEPIFWENNDEIGKMVQEYNRMLFELSESALRLAQSEREGAWREMAKQVAHEIKNPLTPMKLNIQQLQRAWKEDPERLREMFNRVTALLITQIDRLSEIATEFSSFARMPDEQPLKLDINEALREAGSLFHNTDETSVILNLPYQSVYVYMDAGHLARVLNNLIKNAIQAMPEDRLGIIVLSCSEENNKAKIEVRDNGSGIPPALQDKIFMPNFSTKSSGMGLGLAIIKDIIERAGGEIRFETRQGEGTSFFIILPAYNE